MRPAAILQFIQARHNAENVIDGDFGVDAHKWEDTSMKPSGSPIAVRSKIPLEPLLGVEAGSGVVVEGVKPLSQTE